MTAINDTKVIIWTTAIKAVSVIMVQEESKLCKAATYTRSSLWKYIICIPKALYNDHAIFGFPKGEQLYFGEHFQILGF